ncbi:aminotransferase class IV [Psychroflexus halocasei]|uniref:branched-chain-amino-acid transaminase n=1 Tax=Psychroflexus halocasei TaxID=908615 RepID=A0A1H3X0N1_9FLAO|nr:aminotransferase class IV [Psychroflexus halocasei]SDZ92959.1 branched-chain amino acid aminotransferase [Psychroflexus halocasei]
MVNLNGNLTDKPDFSVYNRGLNYGDALFESMRVIHGQEMFWESHYFRLMSSMRILRMEIPQSFSPEYLLNQIKLTLKANELEHKPARVKILVFRKDGGLYKPDTREIDFVITCSELDSPFYKHHDIKCEVDLFKDHFVLSGMLSNLKTTSKLPSILGSIYADENDLDNCILLNEKKSVIEFTNANLFLVKGNLVKTPPLSDGCLKGVFRSELIKIISKMDELTIEESSISPFEIQKSDELFMTNSIQGIQSVSRYRKKEFKNGIAKKLVNKINAELRLTEKKVI